MKKVRQRHHILHHLNGLPQKIITLHGNDNITEFVLHELCSEECFGVDKAAYFVENRDFNCIKGVAGFYRPESYVVDNIWQSPENFTIHMQAAPFNQKVRSIEYDHSDKRDTDTVVSDLVKELEINNPKYYVWNGKHDNNGIFLCESIQDDDEITVQDILNGLSLLTFCPIF